jgi:hypothetical protein
MAKIKVNNTEITIVSVNEKDYISLTDMANSKETVSRAADVIKNWLRTRYAIEFLSVWEEINNSNFKVVESDHFKMQAGLPNFVLSVSEWIDKKIHYKSTFIFVYLPYQTLFKRHLKVWNGYANPMPKKGVTSKVAPF